jgi:hypothetical protein
VPAVIWYALQGANGTSAVAGCGTHVLTANDYLARRDAMWMRDLRVVWTLGRFPFTRYGCGAAALRLSGRHHLRHRE